MNLLKPGDRCGGSVVLGVIGEGAQADVYEVRAPEGDRCALKVHAVEGGLTSRAAARFGQEVEALATIEHPNVLRFHRAGVDGGRVWILVELVQGETLRARLAPGRVRPPLDDLLRWVAQACDGVAAAHDLGIVHRDVNPTNLLVTPSGTVKVIDFGLAKLAHLGIRTTAGSLVGNLLYTPPEQILKAPPHPGWDVYAMGLVLYEALAGAHPMAAPTCNPLEICARSLTFRPPPLASVAPGLPGDLAYLVDLCLSPSPADRPTMRDLAARLRAALHHLLAPRRAAARNLLLPHPRDPAAEPTVPLPVHPTSAPTERLALPPPPPSTYAATVVLPVVAAAPVPARPSPEAFPGRPSTPNAHDVSAAPVETAARAPRGKRGRALPVALAFAVLAASAAGVWVWRVLGPVAGEGVVIAAGRGGPAASASAPAASASVAPAAPRPGGPGRRARGRGEPRP